MTLKPGTLCLIIHASDQRFVGMECTVISPPDMHPAIHPLTGEVLEPRLRARVEISTGDTRLMPPPWLMPISPDPDDDYIRKEKDKPIEHSAPREPVYVE